MQRTAEISTDAEKAFWASSWAPAAPATGERPGVPEPARVVIACSVDVSAKVCSAPLGS